MWHGEDYRAALWRRQEEESPCRTERARGPGCDAVRRRTRRVAQRRAQGRSVTPSEGGLAV